MDGEMMSLIKIWLWTVSSLTYSYFISFNLPKGKFRLLSLLPVFYLLTFFPLGLNTVTLGGLTAFFLTWLANFKLLLFALDKGPLSADPSISCPRFISIACFPIKLKNHDAPSSSRQQIISNLSPRNITLKFVLLALLSLAYEYKQHLHPKILLAYFCCYMYVALELDLAIVAYLSQKLLGVELEPQFDDPYLSTSLQDFWGRRWNLMVSSILRPTVYEPTRFMWRNKLGTRGAQLVAVLATFGVSGLMHELMLCYLGRVTPSWEVTWFFVLQGVLVALEIMVKRILRGRWRVHPVVSWVITMGILVVTADWLFFPPLLRCRADQRVKTEITALLSCIITFC